MASSATSTTAIFATARGRRSSYRKLGRRTYRVILPEAFSLRHEVAVLRFMSPEQSKPGGASDAPPPDLSKQRDELLRSFTKGSQLTRDLLEAYDRIQSQLVRLQHENQRLRATLEADDSIRELIGKVEALERDKKELLSRVNQVEAAASTYPSLGELETELANFANLHVATNCLHSTLSPRGVARRIREVLEQLVGVEAYVIYLCTAPGELSPITHEGLRPDETPSQAPVSKLHEVVASGVSSILDDTDPSRGSTKAPPALIPLSIDDNVIGVLAIVRCLTHKTQLNNVDFELFKLLGQHAAAALMAAGLYAQAGRTLPKAEAFNSLQH